MLNTRLNDVTISEIYSLIGQPEQRALEFKRDLPGSSDAAVKEFLADVSSLANAQGGDIIFGIHEDDEHLAAGVCGVPIEGIQDEINRLESIIKDSTEPRLLRVQIRHIHLDTDKTVLVIRIPASLSAPHCARHKGSRRYWNRNNTGKYEMDTHDLRQAFLGSQAIEENIRKMHRSAVDNARGANMPIRFSGSHVVVTVAPLDVFREIRDLNIRFESAAAPYMPHGGSFDVLITLEGMLKFEVNLSHPEIARSYALTHRRGFVDSAWSIEPSSTNVPRVISYSRFENGIAQCVINSTRLLAGQGLQPPWTVCCTLVGINHHTVLFDDHTRSKPAHRDEAALPIAYCEDGAVDEVTPLIKLFWSVFGVAMDGGEILKRLRAFARP